jgi:hypothetical protein
MRFVEDLCPPALLYLIFLVVQLGLDLANGLWVTLVLKSVLGVATVVVLDLLCGMGLGVVSWFLVAAPFIITSLATAIAMGTGFDNHVMSALTREKFLADSKMESVPTDSNEITSKDKSE